MKPHKIHAPQDVFGWFTVPDPSFQGPVFISLGEVAFCDGYDAILVPAERPVFLFGFIESNRSDSLK